MATGSFHHFCTRVEIYDAARRNYCKNIANRAGWISSASVEALGQLGRKLMPLTANGETRAVSEWIRSPIHSCCWRRQGFHPHLYIRSFEFQKIQ